MNREHRNMLLDGRLALISPYDPSAGFNVGNAMQRNKLVYAFADAALVVSSDFNKGGTWAGAVEQLDKLRFAPVFIRSTGEGSAGLDGLRKKGALPWPNPQDVAALEAVFNMAASTPMVAPQFDLSRLSSEESSSAEAGPITPMPSESDLAPQSGGEPSAPVENVPDARPPVSDPDGRQVIAQEALAPMEEPRTSATAEFLPAETLFATVRIVIQELLNTPKKAAEVAVALDVSRAQATTWLQRLVDEGLLEIRNKPVVYIAKKKRLC